MAWQFTTVSPSDRGAFDAWQHLNRTYCRGNPATDARFVELLLRHFGSGRELIGFYHDGNETHAAAILTRTAAGRWLLFQPSQMCMSPLLHVPDANLPLLLQSLMRSLPGYGLRLTMPKLDPLYQSTESLAELPTCDTVAFGDTYSIRLDENFECYWAERKKKLRQHARRWFRLVEREKLKVTLVRRDRPDEMDYAVAVHSGLESAGWKGREGSAIEPGTVQCRFYRELLRVFASDGDAVTFQLLFNGMPAASVLGIAAGSTLIVLKTAHDENRREFSPGRIIDYLLLQNLTTEKRFRLVDMYTRARAEELAWATDVRTMIDADFYRSAFTAHLAATIRRVRDTVGRKNTNSA